MRAKVLSSYGRCGVVEAEAEAEAEAEEEGEEE